jgi:hypothetical protein
MTRSSVSPWATGGLYLFASVLVLSPLMDLGSTVWPLRPADMPWRYGFLGLLPGYVHTPILGVILALGVAHWQGHPRVMRLTAALSLLAAILLLLGGAVFILDVLQMRALREEEARAGVLVGGILQSVKYATAAAVLMLLGVGGVATAKAARGAARAKPAPGIVGRE